jgi:hypothetical protein
MPNLYYLCESHADCVVVPGACYSYDAVHRQFEKDARDAYAKLNTQIDCAAPSLTPTPIPVARCEARRCVAMVGHAPTAAEQGALLRP